MAEQRSDGGAARRRRTPATRRRVTIPFGVASALLAVGLAVTLTGGAAPTLARTGLDAEGIGLLADGSRTSVPAGTTPAYLAGTRVLDPAGSPGGSDGTTSDDSTGDGTTPDDSTGEAAEALAAEQRAWLAAGTVPGASGPYGEMVRGALLDLHTLVLDDGAAVAAWSPHWRYVWPRDAAFVAVALARTGHPGDALSVLGFLGRVQAPDGSFQARYLPDGSGPPDDRGPQIDGTGWTLWGAAQVVAAIEDPAARAEARTALTPLVIRSVRHLLDLVGDDGLPPVSSDYWERSEHRLTLGTAAPVLAGLQAGAELLAATGPRDLARRSAAAATASAGAIERSFGPGGFGRYADPDGTSADAASAFLLPPFVETALPGAHEAWLASVPALARPAGGLAPGEDWRQDGVSWTPETALYALAAATSGDTGLATGWLTWIDEHRTPGGAIPEKVLADGSPAAVAPLAWSAACVVLAVGALPAG